MYDAQREQAEMAGFDEILFYNAPDVSGRYRVKIQDIGNGNPDGLIVGLHTSLETKSPTGEAGRADTSYDTRT